MKPFDIALAVLVCALWGINFVAVKVGVTYVPPIFFMGIRFAMVAILLFPWVLRMPRQNMRMMWVLALTMGVYFGILFIGMKGVPAGEAAIIIQLQVPFAALMAMYFFSEHLNHRSLMGMLVAFVGVVVTVGIPKAWGGMLPVALVLISAAIWGLYNNQMKMVPKMHPFALNGFVALVTFPLFFLVSVSTEHPSLKLLHLPWSAYAGVLYTVFVSTLLCYSAWYYLVGKYPVQKVMPFVLLEPAFSMVASNVATGEVIALHTLIGGLICAVGLALIILQRTVRR